MSLHDDLLEQAGHLFTRDPRRPKQASLRRSISAAYYSLFHLLIDEASRLALAGSALGDLRPRLGRAFAHTEMKQVSRAFMLSKQSPKLPPEIDAMVKALPSPPSDLHLVATAFVTLQEIRQEADYNTGRRFSRREAEDLVELGREAFLAWRRIRSTPLAKAYLIALLVAKKWDRE